MSTFKKNMVIRVSRQAVREYKNLTAKGVEVPAWKLSYLLNNLYRVPTLALVLSYVFYGVKHSFVGGVK